ncbi:MAG: ABC transporter ATP-binding protein [Treponema bryantii]|nr:ABC transporter ATP-binding protein [Treponema bryantii]
MKMEQNEFILQIKDLSVSQEEKKLFSDFSLELKSNQIIGIKGPSGKGKTTLLNCIADVLLKDNTFVITGSIQKKSNIKISYVFQEHRLIPFISVLKNVMLPLEKIMPKDEAEQIAINYLKEFELLYKKDNFPNELSGGEKQRVSLARAFAYPSDLLLMDEPFQSQDLEKKQKLILMTKNILQKESRAIIFVSHSEDELEQLCEKTFLL